LIVFSLIVFSLIVFSLIVFFTHFDFITACQLEHEFRNNDFG